MATRERQVYRGWSFDVWTRDGAWFWMFGDGGAIGAAASRDQAEGEGRSVIDQFLGRRCEMEMVREAPARAQSRSRPSPAEGYRSAWNNALDGLARYLTTA